MQQEDSAGGGGVPEVALGEDAGGEATPDQELAGTNLFLPWTLHDREHQDVRGESGANVQGQGGAVHRVVDVTALNEDLRG